MYLLAGVRQPSSIDVTEGGAAIAEGLFWSVIRG